MIVAEPPPRVHASLLGLIGGRLFNSIGNSTLTVLGLIGLAALAWPLLKFLLLDAVWRGSVRTDCLAETVGHEVGACWPFIGAKFDQFMYGFYPGDQRWRVNLVYWLGALLLAPLLVPRVPYKALNAILFFGAFPVVAGILLLGGMLGLQEVETRLWGGLLVTLVISFAGIVGSMPLGILLALGRRSELPVVRSASIVFIEFWRGCADHGPVFRDLYAAAVPSGNWKIDGLLRVLIGVILFSAAYLARWCGPGCRRSRAGNSKARWRLAWAIGG